MKTLFLVLGALAAASTAAWVSHRPDPPSPVVVEKSLAFAGVSPRRLAAGGANSSDVATIVASAASAATQIAALSDAVVAEGQLRAAKAAAEIQLRHNPTSATAKAALRQARQNSGEGAATLAAARREMATASLGGLPTQKRAAVAASIQGETPALRTGSAIASAISVQSVSSDRATLRSQRAALRAQAANLLVAFRP